MKIHFFGPYSWFHGAGVPRLHDSEVANDPGIYLWTVPTDDGELVYYVGETARGFSRRLDEHLALQLSGMYRLYDPDPFIKGQKELLWRGVYGPGSERSIEGFVDRLPELAPSLGRMVRLFRFHLAPTSCEDRLRRRIEAAVAMHLRGQAGIVGVFQDDDVRYSPRREGEDPVEVVLAWEAKPIGAPDILLA